ncbi:MAG: type 2 isopentenyl-diphosphate Delta-isomerase [Melioribacteraceae bacterium]|nr:type 2 isopentenyl-diphosphate Delta-isomerase [Melioribacteraceae bacterium]
MAHNQDTTDRKIDHIRLCLNEDVAFKNKSNGFDKYSFEHDASTEVDIHSIDLETDFFGKTIDLPFMISSMTGGANGSFKINEDLAVVANKLNIPIGVGSQRQALENKFHHDSYKIIKEVSGKVPIIANIGAAQVAKGLAKKEIDLILNIIEADALIIHLNPLQELIQKDGNIYFKGLADEIENLVKEIEIPIVIKEVGSGISKSVANKFLNIGVKGIDVAGAGGTSWAGVEYLRNGKKETPYWDWGLPTSYCLRKVRELKVEFDFMLIGSGGVNSGTEIAKAIALGADVTASARIVLKTLAETGVDKTVLLIENWFKTLKEIMYLTGCQTLKEFKNVNMIKSGDIY